MFEPSWAERARTTLAAHHSASLATIDTDGRPVVGTVPMIADGSGTPVTVLSNLSTHTSRGRQDQRAAMSVGDRLLLQGDLRPVPGLQQIEMTDQVVDHYPKLRAQVESLDYSWFRLVPTRVRWIDDDDNERWLRPEDVAGAEPDPLVDFGPEFLADVADRIDDNILLIAKTLGGRWLGSHAELVAIDRYGITLAVDEPAGKRQSRVPFAARLSNATEVNAALGSLVRAARSVPRDDEASNAVREMSAAGVSSAPGLLDAIERDGGGGADVDGIDGPAHPNPNALIHGLQHAAAQTRALGPQQETDTILFTEAELFESDGIRPWREGEQPETMTTEYIETVGEGLEAGVGERVGLAHGDTPGTSIEGIATGGIQDEGIDAEAGRAAEDDSHVRGVVDGFQDHDGADALIAEHLVD